MHNANLLSNDKCDVVHHSSRQLLQIRMLCIIEFPGFPCWIQPLNEKKRENRILILKSTDIQDKITECTSSPISKGITEDDKI